MCILLNLAFANDYRLAVVRASRQLLTKHVITEKEEFENRRDSKPKGRCSGHRRRLVRQNDVSTTFLSSIVLAQLFLRRKPFVFCFHRPPIEHLLFRHASALFYVLPQPFPMIQRSVTLFGDIPPSPNSFFHCTLVSCTARWDNSLP